MSTDIEEVESWGKKELHPDVRDLIQRREIRLWKIVAVILIVVIVLMWLHFVAGVPLPICPIQDNGCLN